MPIIICHLKKICKDKGISEIAELRAITGLSLPILHRMLDNENADKISLGKFVKICNTMNICIYDLIEFTDKTYKF